MKLLRTFLLAAISASANAMPSEPVDFQGLSRGDQAAACQAWFSGNVDYLLKRAETALDSEVKRDMRRRSYPVAGMSIIAGRIAGRTVADTADQLRSIGAFDPGSSRRQVGVFCMALFAPAYINYSKDRVFQTEVANLVHSRSHEQYLAAGGNPKYAERTILAAGIKGVLLGTPAADAERLFLVAYPEASISCLSLSAVPQAFHCQVTPRAGADLLYANLPTSSIIYYLHDTRVVGFGVVFPSANARTAFDVLESNIRTLAPIEPQVERQPSGKITGLAWQSGQEVLFLQSDENKETYLTYGVKSFLERMMEASMPALQSEKGM